MSKQGSPEKLLDVIKDGLEKAVQFNENDTKAQGLLDQVNDHNPTQKLPSRLLWDAVDVLKGYEPTKAQAERLIRKINHGNFQNAIEKRGLLGDLKDAAGYLWSVRAVKYPILIAAGSLAGYGYGDKIASAALYGAGKAVEIGSAAIGAVPSIVNAVVNGIPQDGVNVNIPGNAVAAGAGAVGGLALGVTAGAATAVGTGIIVHRNATKKHEKRMQALKDKAKSNKFREDGLSRAVYEDKDGKYYRLDKKGKKQYVQLTPYAEAAPDGAPQAVNDTPHIVQLADGTMAIVDSQGNRTVLTAEQIKNLRGKRGKKKNRASASSDDAGEPVRYSS
ncbi:MAG: hypothetical protein HOO67_02760 [Candidatus Peribacteraceae bacterium]|nr:hypothetical protein [Candidatus Peribacteraceae bacterium]